MGGLVKPPKAILPKPKKIVLNAAEAAIVFRYNGVYFVYPEEDSAPPADLLDTLDFMRYALERPDWLEEFRDETAWTAALTDLATEEMPPRLQVLEGGLQKNDDDDENERGPFAPPPAGEE